LHFSTLDPGEDSCVMHTFPSLSVGFAESSSGSHPLVSFSVVSIFSPLPPPSLLFPPLFLPGVFPADGCRLVSSLGCAETGRSETRCQQRAELWEMVEKSACGFLLSLLASFFVRWPLSPTSFFGGGGGGGMHLGSRDITADPGTLVQLITMEKVAESSSSEAEARVASLSEQPHAKGEEASTSRPGHFNFSKRYFASFQDDPLPSS
jgi:hypothetical protein